MNKLHLGCGNKYLEGYINVDFNSVCKVDILMDFGKDKLQVFDDDFFDEIYSSHALEHILPSDYIELIEDMYRVSKHNCVWNLELPFDNPNHRTNPYHFRTYWYDCWDSFIVNHHNNKQNIFLEDVTKQDNFFKRIIYSLVPALKGTITFKLIVKKMEMVK